MRRVDEVLSSLGYCSRKEAQHWCDEGRIALEGGGDERLLAKARVEPERLRVDGLPLDFPHGLLVMLHKPVGYVCSHDASEGRRVYDLLPPRWLKRKPAVTSVGRLDKDTSGLLLITDVGALVQRWTSPKHHAPKTYLATLDVDPPASVVERLAQGIELKEGDERWLTQPAEARLLGERQVEITLTEGKYHQVRRMFTALGCEVVALHRTRFANWALGELSEGQWQPLPIPAL